MKLGVIGAGSWGTTLASLLGKRGHDVSLWVYEEELLASMKSHRVNHLYLPGVKIEESVFLTGDLGEACRGAECLIMAVPSHVYRDVLERMAPSLRGDEVLVSATKGIEAGTLMTMSQVAASVLGEVRYAVLSGPSFAREVSLGLPTAVTVAAFSLDLAQRLQEEFSTERFRVYAHDDVLGTELGGAIKNVIAIAAGISDGLGLGLNARAALITRGLSEMIRLGAKMGANPLTFGGLSGVGDLILTCTGDLSRNRTVGLRIAKGESLEQIRKSMLQVAEGVTTTLSLRELARREGVDMPIAEQVYLVLYEGKDPLQAMKDLMNRPLKREIYFHDPFSS
jgi:glycerol-3-phosphate dehydrogenase (NAD(P)+)